MAHMTAGAPHGALSPAYPLLSWPLSPDSNPPTSSLTSVAYGILCLTPTHVSASLGMRWGLSASTAQGPWPLGDHTPPPSSPRHLSPALPLFTLAQPPLPNPSYPPEHFPEPPPALFFSSVSLGMGDRIFLGPSASLILSLCHSASLLGLRPPSKRLSLAGVADCL